MLKPGTFCRLRYILPMNRCVVAAVVLAGRIVVVAADLRRNMAAEITTERTRAVADTAIVDRIDVVAAPNTAGSILRTSRTRWTSRVLISLTVPAQLDVENDSLCRLYRMLCSCKLYTYMVDQPLHCIAKQHMIVPHFKIVFDFYWLLCCHIALLFFRRPLFQSVPYVVTEKQEQKNRKTSNSGYQVVSGATCLCSHTHVDTR